MKNEHSVTTYQEPSQFLAFRFIVLDDENPALVPCPEMVPAAALGCPLAAASCARNLGLAHEPGFEWTEAALGSAVVFADWTKL